MLLTASSGFVIFWEVQKIINSHQEKRKISICVFSPFCCVSLSTPSSLWWSPKMTDQLIWKRSFTQKKIPSMKLFLIPSGRICAIKSPDFLNMSCLNQFILCLPFSCSACHLGGCSRNIKHPHFLLLRFSFHSYFIEPFSMLVIGSSSSSESWC